MYSLCLQNHRLHSYFHHYHHHNYHSVHPYCLLEESSNLMVCCHLKHKRRQYFLIQHYHSLLECLKYRQPLRQIHHFLR